MNSPEDGLPFYKSRVVQIIITIHAQSVGIVAFWLIQSICDMTRSVAFIANGAVRDQVIDIRMAYAKAR